MSNFFDSAYRKRPPWDVGRPQADMLALLDELAPADPALDVGCGTGELALAGRGLSALGVDLAAAAIEEAQAKAKAAGLASRASFGWAMRRTRHGWPGRLGRWWIRVFFTCLGQ